MNNNFYFDGAIHNDHSKNVEIKLNSAGELSQFLRDFMKDNAEEVQCEEVEQPEVQNQAAQDSGTKPRTSKGNARSAPTYALSKYGKEHEELAKKCAKDAYQEEWGKGALCTYLIRVLQQKSIIDKTGASTVRLLMHWGILSIDESEVTSISDNWNEKLKSLSGEPEIWDIPDDERFIYNTIWECFEESFPSPQK